MTTNGEPVEWWQHVGFMPRPSSDATPNTNEGRLEPGEVVVYIRDHRRLSGCWMLDRNGRVTKVK